MTQPRTLLQTMQRLNKEELVRYASNMGMEVDEKLTATELRRAYADYILNNPKEILFRLPMKDLDFINRARKKRSQTDLFMIDLHITPIMVLYGLADAEPPYEDTVGIYLPEDLCNALFPHIQWALNDRNNQLRQGVEIAVEALANVLGFVNQEDLSELLKVVIGSNSDEDAQKVLNIVRQYSLLLDSMEWTEDGMEVNNDAPTFVSRFAWADKNKMKQYINAHSNRTDHPATFDVKDLALASGSLLPIIPNERGEAFIQYLTSTLGFDTAHAYMICFNLWYYKTRKGEYGEGDEALELYFLSNVLGAMNHDLSDEQAEEAMKRMADYVNHLPLWQLAGHTAAEYPSEAFVRKLTTKEPLGPVVRELRKEARRMTDILNGKSSQSEAPKNEYAPQNPWANKHIGRNDPCPCGSGLKYKKCHGK